jgi:hypothetical protein
VPARPGTVVTRLGARDTLAVGVVAVGILIVGAVALLARRRRHALTELPARARLVLRDG